jgi:hypothetical protein
MIPNLLIIAWGYHIEAEAYLPQRAVKVNLTPQFPRDIVGLAQGRLYFIVGSVQVLPRERGESGAGAR